MSSRVFTAADIALVLRARAAGKLCREIAVLVNATGGVAVNALQVESLIRRTVGWPTDEAGIQAKMDARRKNPLRDKSRSDFQIERERLMQRMIDMTNEGMGRRAIAKALGVPFSRIVYLRRSAVARGLLDPQLTYVPDPLDDPRTRNVGAPSESKPKMRVYAERRGPCLMCGRPMMRSKVERICKSCKQTDRWRGYAA